MRRARLVLAAMALASPAAASGTEEHRALMVAGQLMRSDGKLMRARDLLAECAELPCDAGADAECASIQNFCRERLAQVEREIPVVRFTTIDDRGRSIAGASLRVGGLAVGGDGALALDPGKYVLRAEYLGRGAAVDFEVPTTTAVRAVIDLRRTVTERPIPAPVWILAAVSGISLGVFGGFAYAAERQTSGFADCEPTCDQSKKSMFRATAVTAEIALGVGVVAGLGAVIWYLVRPTVERVEHVGPGGA